MLQGESRTKTNAEDVHRLFRGAMELVKWLRNAAISTEMIAAIAAAWRAFDPDLRWNGWASLLLAMMLLLGIAMRIWARSIHGFSERCRRIAIKAYANDYKISMAMATSLKADAPFFTDRLSRRLPTQTLDEYYETSFEPGNGRLRELYAHSAFYSWRLLRFAGRAYLFVGIVFSAVGFFVIYSLAVLPLEATISGRMLDVICSIVFVVLAGKAFEAGIDALLSSRECRKVSEGLIENVDVERILGFVADYDIERAVGPTIPTSVYRFLRDELQREWLRQREGLQEST